MRTNLIVLTLATLVSACSPSGNEEDVQQAIKEAFSALAAKDVKKMATLCTTDVMILENGIIWNLDSITSNMNATPNGLKRINSFEFIRTDISGNTAWVAYRNKADVTLNEKRRAITWLESATLKKVDGRWKLQLLHSTVLERKVIND